MGLPKHLIIELLRALKNGLNRLTVDSLRTWSVLKEIKVGCSLVATDRVDLGDLCFHRPGGVSPIVVHGKPDCTLKFFDSSG